MRRLIRETPPGSYTALRFHVLALTAGLSLDNGEQENPQRVPGNPRADDQNFGLLRFSGRCNDRLLTMETYDSKGTLRGSTSCGRGTSSRRARQRRKSLDTPAVGG